MKRIEGVQRNAAMHARAFEEGALVRERRGEEGRDR